MAKHERVVVGTEIKLKVSIDSGGNTIAVFDGADGMGNGVVILFQVGFKGCQVVGTDLGEHSGDHLLLPYHAFRQIRGLGYRGTEGCQRGCHIGGFRLDRQRVIGQCVRLYFVDILLESGGQGHNQSNTDDADGTGKGGQQCPR